MKFNLVIISILFMACARTAPKSWTSSRLQPSKQGENLTVLIMGDVKILNTNRVHQNLKSIKGDASQKFKSYCHEFLVNGFNVKRMPFSRVYIKWIERPVILQSYNAKIKKGSRSQIKSFDLHTFQDVERVKGPVLVLEEFYANDRVDIYADVGSGYVGAYSKSIFSLGATYSYYGSDKNLYGIGEVVSEIQGGVAKGSWKLACQILGSKWIDRMIEGRLNIYVE